MGVPNVIKVRPIKADAPKGCKNKNPALLSACYLITLYSYRFFDKIVRGIYKY